MNDKSHVSLERRVCMICGEEYETGAILLDRRLRASLERNTVTGAGLCTEHQKMFDEGFIALVECDPAKSGPMASVGTIRSKDAYRTGQVAHMKRDVFDRIFKMDVKPDLPFVFVELGVIAYIDSKVHGTAH